MAITIEVKGIPELVRRADLKSKALEKELDSLVQRLGSRIEYFAKGFAPVKTGRLRNSIHYQRTGHAEAEVSDGVHYGVFVEFGTSRMKPKPFFRPAIDISKVVSSAEMKVFSKKALG